MQFIKSQVKDFRYILEKDFSLNSIGDILNEGWMKKRELSKHISSPEIDAIYTQIVKNGCLGAKLSGAGGGGFFLCLVP